MPIKYSRKDLISKMKDIKQQIEWDKDTAKLFGENLGRLLVDEGKCSFLVIRICSVRSKYEDHPFAYAEQGVKQNLWLRNGIKYMQQLNRLKGLWHSRRDFLNMTGLLLNTEIMGFDIFYGVSDNTRRWFDIQNAVKKIGYKSKDNAEKFINSPFT